MLLNAPSTCGIWKSKSRDFGNPPPKTQTLCLPKRKIWEFYQRRRRRNAIRVHPKAQTVKFVRPADYAGKSLIIRQER